MFAVSKPSRWNTRHHRPRSDVAGHDRPGTDQGAGTDRHTTQYHRAAADRGPTADTRGDHAPVLLGLKSAPGGGPRVQVVDEHHAMPHEDLVFNRYTFTNERVTLNLAVGANRDVFLNLDERADARIVADFTTIEVNERVQGDVFPQPDVRGDPDEVGRIRSLVLLQTR